MLKFLAVLLVVVVALVEAAPKMATRAPTLIQRSMLLSPDYEVSWVVDLAKAEPNITVTVLAATHGFIGFGLSPQGGMNNADIVIGGVDPQGKPYFSDRWATGKKEPKIDDHQDWHLLNAGENVNGTMIRFTRRLETCDPEDLPINNDTTRFIFSMGNTDTIEYHAARGSQAVNILDPLLTIVDTSEFDVWNIDVNTEIPASETTYWCSVHKSPKYTSKRHIVGFNVKLDSPEAIEHNHHLIIHKCYTQGNAAIETILELATAHPGLPCYTAGTGGDEGSARAGPGGNLMDYCKTYQYAWAKGASALFLPEDVGFPLNEDGKSEYVLLEIHYDNPKKLEGIKYPTGVEVFTTTDLRKHEAGLLTVGHSINSATLVPPNTTDFVNVGHCSTGCTTKKFPAEGIHMFNIGLHSHLAGRKLKLRHFRGNKELPWISSDDHWDFNYQQNRPMVEPRHILPGDQLTYECTYDSTYRETPSSVIGGLTTHDEMCECFNMYYPRMPELDRCGSSYPVNKLMPKFGIQEWGTGRDPVVLAPASLANKRYTTVLDTIVNWTDQFRADLQEAMRYESHNEVCQSYSDSDRADGTPRVTGYPVGLEEYEPPARCEN